MKDKLKAPLLMTSMVIMVGVSGIPTLHIPNLFPDSNTETFVYSFYHPQNFMDGKLSELCNAHAGIQTWDLVLKPCLLHYVHHKSSRTHFFEIFVCCPSGAFSPKE